MAFLMRSDDLDISDRSSDGLRNVVMGRVMDDGSWTEVGRFSDVNITFHGEPMPEEFKTRYLNIWDEVSLTAELEPTFAKQIADEIYEAHIMPFLSQMADQLAQTQEICICYANPNDRNAVEFIKSIYGTMPLRVSNNVIYTHAVEKGMIYLIPASKLYTPSPLFGIQATMTTIDELAAYEQRKPPVHDISWIRKQMKHCKNPMERKALEKELNAAFKEKKRRRKK